MTGRHSGQQRAGRLRMALALGGAGLASAVIVVAILAALGAGHPAGPRTATTGRVTPASLAASSRPVTSPPVARPRHRDPFGSAATAYLASRSGSVLAAVYDLRTGQIWTLGQGPPQAEASVVKLDILETLLARHARSGLTSGDQALAGQMIEDSDNDAATSLWDAVGGARGLSAYDTATGLTRTTPSRCVACPGFPWPGWGLTTTLPADQITLLRRLVESSPLLTSPERRYALSLLENVTPSQRWGVSGGVPAGVTVALKNGWLPLNDADTDWQVNSVGWISGRGRDYLMAVLTTGDPDEQYGIDTIGRLASLVWSALG